MIIHDVRVDIGTIRLGDDGTEAPGTSIVVGATDLQRWDWELEDGRPSAVDAKTLVCVELAVARERWAPTERACLFVARVDPLRDAAIAAIPALLAAAWEICDAGWDREAAVSHVYGRRVGGG